MSALSVRAAAREAGDRAALIFGDTTWTWSRLASEVEAELGTLVRVGVLGDGSGDSPRVAFDAIAEPATIVRIFALLEIGIPFVLLHHGLTERERARQLDAVQPCIDLDRAAVAEVAEKWADDRRESPGGARTPADADPLADSDLMAILFTSGSSGSPRAVELSRAAFLASAAASAARLGWQEDDRWLCCLPIAHVGGLSILIRCLIARRTVVLIPRFNPAAVVEALDRHAVTLASLVPAMLVRLLRLEPSWSPSPSLRVVLLGGSPAPEAIWGEAERRGIPLRATYGLTETCSQVATAKASTPRDLVPLDGIDVRVRDGCIEVGGLYVYSCTLTSDGYLRTGDLGRLRPDGVLEVLGRADDLIITGGENVMPAEVEAELETHPQILRAVVFGLPDAEWGEIVVAVLVADGSPPT
ncbi:MAG: AMP-binding protein, partial [Gemmatimonadota bacterium]